ncbi:MAG: DUF2800 domain-containing protein [Pseudomonadota bacterium]
MSAAHSKLGASSMYRWSACPASVRQSVGIESVSSAYAQEGTEAHEWAAKVLQKVCTLDAIPDADMAEAVKVYVDAVMAKYINGGTLLIEHRFDLSAVYPGCFGTADAVVYDPVTRVLHVFDYKHGAGIPVEVEDNPQLKYYALGALVTTDFRVAYVRMTIVQPRCNHPEGPIRSYQIPAVDLLDFRADLVQFSKATEDVNAKHVSGDHCRFCPGAGLCPELHAQANEVAKLEFSPTLPYDPVVLRRALDSREVVKAWLKALDEFAYREAEAGRCPPGYKLVAKRATRKWKDDAATVDWLQDAGFTASQIYERTLKSPPQIEALFPKKSIPEALPGLYESVSSGHTLAPESDKRPAAKSNAADDFSPVVQTN